MQSITDTLNTLYQQAESAVASLLSKTHFLFIVADQPKDTFKVIHWQGTEALSSSYQYSLTLAASELIDATQYFGKSAQFSLNCNGEMRVIHGLIRHIEHIGKRVDESREYLVIFASPLARLHLTRQCRIFLNLDLKSVIEQVLLTAGFAATGFKIDLNTPYPVREYIAQYNETDFNFFSRLLEHAGVFYSFVQQDEQALLVIQDDSASLPRMKGKDTLIYLPASGQVEDEESVQQLHTEQHYLTQHIKRRDYNYRTPESTLLGSATSASKLPASGTDYTYGEHAASLEEIEQLARRRQQMVDCQREVYIAESNCRSITSGTTFSISGHPQYHYNGDYLVVSVLHQGDQSAAFAFGGASSEAATAKTYHNELTLIKKDTPYRPPVDRTRQPLMAGGQTAKTETTGGDYAYLDDQGRYRIKFLFDENKTNAGEASHPVRMMQQLSGANYGIHFPLHAGTEVLVTCLNGDPDRPIIMGSLSNPASRSPVTSANASQHIIRTYAGNELLMDDLADSEKINLHTKGKKNILTLDANSDGHKIALRSEEGKAEFYAKKTMRFESGDTYSIISGNDQTITVENKHSLQTNKKDIAFNAATDIALTAKQHIKLNAEEKDISLTSGQDLIVEVGKGMAVRVMDGDSSYTIQQGSVSIEAAKAITILSIDGPITLENGGGSVELSDGKLSVMGTTVSIEGSSVNIKGQTVGMLDGGVAPASKAKVAAQTQAVAAKLLAATTGTGLGMALAATQAPGSGKTTTKPVATAAPAATTEKAKETETGRFITAAEGQGIVGAASGWEDTPYSTGKYAGGNPLKKKGADCSGSVWAIYKEAGLSYGTYTNTAGFPARVGTDANFVKGTHYFKKVDKPQVGDVGWWNGHMALFDPNAGKTGKGLVGNAWSASSPTSDRLFGPAQIKWFERDYGTKPTWYRYWKAGAP